MAEKVTKKFLKGKSQLSISTSASDLSVYFCDPNGVEHENVHSEVETSDVIALSTAADLNVPATPTYQERFIEKLDTFKADPYWTEAEIEFKAVELGWPPSIGRVKVKVKRGLQKVVKSFKKRTKD